MKTWVSWNVRGMCQAAKRKIVKQSLGKLKPELILLQETKLDGDREKFLETWANSLNMDFAAVSAVGSAGGLATLWKRNCLTVSRVVQNQRFLLLEVSFGNGAPNCLIVNVYGPNDEGTRGEFFANLGLEISQMQGVVVIGGDFNATLNDGERKGNNSSLVGDLMFKHFVETYELIDLPLLKDEFTWGSTRGDGIWSRIDRWLLNEDAIIYFDGAHQSAEEWSVSDHRPVSLSLGSNDYGPKPFCFFNYWLMEDGFKKMVEDWWCSAVVEGWSSFALMHKLKGLRAKIREWNKSRGIWGSEKIKYLEDQLQVVVNRMESEGVDTQLRKDRLEVLNQLWKEYRVQESRMLQKSRIRWIR